MNNEKILVIIPAYEDKALPETIKGLLGNALNPDRIYISLGLQYSKVDISEEISDLIKNDRIFVHNFDVETRPGVNKIRSILSEDYTDQDYFMMIDAHSSFVTYWDSIMINRYKEMQSEIGERVVWSRPVDIEPGITKGFPGKTVWKPYFEHHGQNEFIELGFLLKQWDGSRFVKTNWMCSHFAFTDAKWLKEVGIPKNIQQFCEEELLTVSSYVAGWKVYADAVLNPVGHNPNQFNLDLYGDTAVQRSKKSFGQSDSEETKRWVMDYIVNCSPLVKEFLEDVGGKHMRDSLIILNGLEDRL